MRIALVDSDDSFVHNLRHALAVSATVTVLHRSEEATQPWDLVVLGPGPGRPDDSDDLQRWIEAYIGHTPLFGVCLGLQAIGLHFGAQVVVADPVHGKTSLVFHQSSGLFSGLPNPVPMTRYHSLVLCEHSLPPCLQITATAADNTIQAVQHTSLPVWGVQFHPEAARSAPWGERLLHNVTKRSRYSAMSR